MTTGQKANLTRMNRILKEAQKRFFDKKNLDGDSLPLQHFLDAVEKEYWNKITAKRKATMKKKGITTRGTIAKSTSDNLTHIATNPSKHAVYCMLDFEAMQLSGEQHAITMPSTNTAFEDLLLSRRDISFSFLERSRQAAKKISENFADIKHNLHIGSFPDTSESLREDYPTANFVWLDLMGRYLDRYTDEIDTLMSMCERDEMVFSITIGNRGRAGTSDSNEVAAKLQKVFDANGWKTDRMTSMRYKSQQGTKMNCLIYRLVSDGKRIPKNDDLTPGQRAWATRRQRYGEKGRKGLTAQQRAWATRRQRYGEKGRR